MQVFEELDWAQEHDQEAAAIAAEGGRTAATYLTGNARACYWFRWVGGGGLVHAACTRVCACSSACALPYSPKQRPGMQTHVLIRRSQPL